MRELSEEQIAVLRGDCPVAFFLFEIAAPDLPGPIRVAQIDLVSNGAHYVGVPFSLDSTMDGDVLTVRGAVGAIRQFLKAIHLAPVTVRVIMETAPDDVLAEYAATFWAREDPEDADILGHVRLAPKTQKARPAEADRVTAQYRF